MGSKQGTREWYLQRARPIQPNQYVRYGVIKEVFLKSQIFYDKTLCHYVIPDDHVDHVAYIFKG